MDIHELESKIHSMVDDLQGLCSTVGLSNTANEEVVVTSVFLYKFLNDKFMYNLSKFSEEIDVPVESILKNEDDMLDAFYEYNSKDVAFSYEDTIQYLINHLEQQDFYKQFDDALVLIYKTTKALDKTRPCIDTSGNFHVITDIFDLHDYEQDPKVFKEHFDMLMTEGKLYDNHERRQKYTGGPTFISEYGGIRWSVNENEQNAWGYGNAPKNKYEFIERYKGLTDALLDNDRMF